VAGLATSTGFAGHASRPHAATSHQPPRIAIAEFEKTSLVAKLKAARDRKRAATGKCGGRKTYPEARPETVALARKLRREQRMSLQEIAAELAR
jgi:hypothetical protein